MSDTTQRYWRYPGKTKIVGSLVSVVDDRDRAIISTDLGQGKGAEIRSNERQILASKTVGSFVGIMTQKAGE